MSHELRTPLNSLLILSRLLAENREGNLRPKQVEFAETINGAGRDLLELINDVLDLSKAEAGKMEVNLAAVALAEVRDDVERSFRPVAEERGLAFAIDVADELPATLVTDQQRLSQVLRNLLSNAFKFTSEGSVTLAVSATGEPVPRVAFEVRDTGVGIPEEKLGLIFEAFQQADGTTSRQYGGTGLGLSITQEIARLLGGEIRVRSQAGGASSGSAFAFVLPLAGERRGAPALPPAPAPPAPARPAPVALAPSKPADAPLPHDPVVAGKQVLVVDDDIRNVFALASVLEEHGMEVVFAEDGREGIAQLREHPGVELVLLDVMMPGMDGYETARTIRAMPQWAELPLIVLTANAMPGDRAKAFAAGASEYVAKPVGADELLELMRRWLRR